MFCISLLLSYVYVMGSTFIIPTTALEKENSIILPHRSSINSASYFSFYDNDLVATHSFTNLYQASSVDNAQMAALKYNQTSLVSVYNALWVRNSTAHCLSLRTDYKTRLVAVAQAARAVGMKNSTSNGPILGFNLGDELVWNCLDVSDLLTGANAVRSLFPRGEAIIWYNEAAMLAHLVDSCHVHHPDYVIPSALDWFSVDIYHMDGPVVGWVNKYVRGFYKQYIYPNLTANQYALLVPGSFGSNVNHYPNGTYICNNDCYDRMCAADAYDFFKWFQEDSKVVAIAPWNWNGCPTCNGSRWTPPHTCCMDEIGTKDQPLTRAAWEDIGKKIITH